MPERNGLSKYAATVAIGLVAGGGSATGLTQWRLDDMQKRIEKAERTREESEAWGQLLEKVDRIEQGYRAQWERYGEIKDGLEELRRERDLLGLRIEVQSGELQRIGREVEQLEMRVEGRARTRGIITDIDSP